MYVSTSTLHMETTTPPATSAHLTGHWPLNTLGTQTLSSSQWGEGVVILMRTKPEDSLKGGRGW